MRNPERIRFVSLVALGFQRGAHVLGLQTRRRQAKLEQFAMQPGRQRAGLVTDAPQEADGRSSRRSFSEEQKRAIVQETEKPGVSVSQVCRRHGVATRMAFRWRVQFGLVAKMAPRLATVALAKGAASEVPALAALHNLVQPPDGMIAVQLEDGRRVFASAGSSPAEVKRQLARKEKAS